MLRASAAKPFGSSTDIPHCIDTSHSECENRGAQRTRSHCADSIVVLSDTAGKRASPTAREGVTIQEKNTHSPGSHGPLRTDVLTSSRSDTSASSVASSVFSAVGTMSHPGRTASLQALTPLTSSDSSPPGKLPSPRSAKPPNETMHATHTSHNAPTSAAKNGADTITPVNTPPETIKSIWPADGNIGVKMLYDPHLDRKLHGDERRKYKAK